MKKFHENLTYVVKEVLSVSGYEVNKTTGIHVGGFINWMKGMVSPSVKQIEPFCLHYDISPTYLFFGIGPVKISEIKGGETTAPVSQTFKEKKELGAKLDEVIDLVAKTKKEFAI